MDDKALALLERIANAVEYLANYHGGTFQAPAPPSADSAPAGEAKQESSTASE